MLLIANSCGKVCGCYLPVLPKPLNFEVIGKDGKSMVNSLKDSITITYLDNNYSNTNKTIRLSVKKLYTNFSDTTTLSSNYNGFYITDNREMSILSSQVPPANTFNLSINGLSVGVININLKQYQATYPYLSAVALNFNNTSVSYDNGVNLLQLY
jgi:hypothetical protein